MWRRDPSDCRLCGFDQQAVSDVAAGLLLALPRWTLVWSDPFTAELTGTAIVDTVVTVLQPEWLEDLAGSASTQDKHVAMAPDDDRSVAPSSRRA